MLEPWRSRYLQALGVDIYVPREALPGARAPFEPAWDPAALAAASPAPIEAGQPAPASPAATVPREAARLPELERPREVPRPAAPRPAKSAEPPAAAAGIRFGLTVAQAEGVVIVDEAPLAGAHADYQKLLTNLLFALQGRQPALSFDQFQWPPAVRIAQLDHGEAAARETLTAYLQKRLEGAATLLLLGESASRWIPPELRRQLIEPSRACGISAVSAWRCLREPAAKRQLWQDLRALAAPR